MTCRPTRRTFFELASAAAMAELVGCGSGDGEGDGGGSSSLSGGTSDGSADTDPTVSTDATAEGSGTTGPGNSGPGPADSSGTDDNAGTEAGTDDDTGAGVCEASPGSIEGPFHRPDIPIRSDLDLYGDAGIPVRLAGRVVDGACAPVVGAIVELWHATPSAPRREPGDIDATYDNGDEHRYYGQVATDREGHYAFETLKPGWYLNGAAYRPAHLHLKIWADGVERLTTQLYFEGDPFNEGDPWFDPTMVLALDPDGAVSRDFAI